MGGVWTLESFWLLLHPRVLSTSDFCLTQVSGRIDGVH